MASRSTTPRRSLSFKWKNVLKRTRTSSMSSTDAMKTKEGYDDLSDYWRPLPDTPGAQQSKRSNKQSTASKTSLGHIQPMSPKQLEIVDRDSEYYIESGDVVLLVQNTLFRVHRYFLIRESPVFRDMLSLPVPKDVEVEGSSDNAPIQLLGITSDDFAKFLWTFYNSRLSEYDGATIKEWLGVLRLAHMWDCDNVRELAFRELEKLNLPPLERVIVGRDYDAPPAWMKRAKEALADRHEYLTEHEAQSLGASLAITIAALRERRRDRRYGIYRPDSRSSSRRDSLISISRRSQSPPGHPPIILEPPFIPHYMPPTPPYLPATPPGGFGLGDPPVIIYTPGEGNGF